MDPDMLQEGKIDQESPMKCQECEQPYSIKYWREIKDGFDEKTEFICKRCEKIKQSKKENTSLDEYKSK